MSKSLSLILEEDILQEADDAAKVLHVGREAFISRAIRAYARQVSRRRLKNQLRKESAMTSEESMRVLHEFEAIS
jgi:hypothetical protein